MKQEKKRQIRHQVPEPLDLVERKRAHTGWWRDSPLLSILNKISDIVSLVDQEGVHLYVSPSIEKITGFNRKELTRPFFELIHPEDLPHVTEVWESGLRQPETPIQVEFRFRCRNGGYVWLEASGTNYFDDPSIGLGIITTRDISERKKAQQRLKESESRFSALFHNSQLGMMITDLKTGVILEVNHALSNTMELSRDEIVGKTTLEVNFWPSPEFRQKFLKLVQEQSSELFEHELHYTTKSGKKVVYRFTSEIIQIGSTKCLLSVAQNVTDRAIAETALKESERRLSTLMNNLQGMAYQCLNEPGWPTSFLSEGCVELLEYEPEELMRGKLQYNDLILPEFRKPVWEHVQTAVQANQKFQLVYQIKTRSGKVKWVWEQGQAIYNDQGEIIALEGFVTDITEQKQAEDALKLNEAKYRTLVTQSPDGIFVADIEGNLLSVNAAMSEHLQYSEKELLSMSVWDFVSPEYKNQHLERMSDMLKGEPLDEPVEYKVTCKDGSIGWAEVVSFPYFNDDTIVGFQGIARDVTGRKEADRRLKEALERAKESDRLKSTFLATMSHELRTPLNAVIGFSELIDETTPMWEILEYRETIKNSGKHLLNIVEGIFDIAMIEAGVVQLHKEQFDINQTMTQLLGMMLIEQKKLKRTNLDLRLDPDFKNEPLFIYADKQKITQILINLLKNALKYSFEGYIEFGYDLVENEAGYFIQFHVSDSGIGIPENKKEIIFEIFRQADDSHTRLHGGVGIGLSVAKKLTELHGGKIWVSSDEGKGSTFYFTIPFEQLENPDNSGKYNSRKVNQVLYTDKTILIAEDNQVNFTFMKACLRNTGARILWVKNGEEALRECVQNQSVDIALMDIKMPVMDGIEATRKIKEIRPEMPIVAQTAYVPLSQNEELQGAGFDDFISKPIDRTQLFEILNKFLVKNGGN